MTGSSRTELIAVERRRIQLEYERRAREIAPDLYAPWQYSCRLEVDGRNRVAAEMLHRLGVFPKSEDQCLDIGFGSLSWISALIGWGVKERSLHGIELDHSRNERARELLPMADLRTGDAVELPWADSTFQLVITSTLFTSILDRNVRQLVADEIVRVLAPGGALLWYDFAYNNPRNPNVRGIGRGEIKRLFPILRGKVRTITLAPPLARSIAPHSWALATLLDAIPILRTHLIGILIKDKS
jgi:SAM-dependent methyltransferase